ncbi:outer membrane lipoprotein carrier protein LolA [Oceanihabitans sediminis]|uniref:LolA family protein n=1 Tax=Oceanihabitans sediminis TaxID=1812012 RepID=UPI00299F200B|nr:outer membrane lipoprotein carrier protein LolA [Oceanihabitans sediminis]MDX1278645.1 outer membrane lipoprotein carrier protein LolA [Oceanihabitans sediminis]MDX1772873.1 outer membrane lipoprotein carrier protein LolA [Oceanihabitans sediminis]
MPKIFYLLFFMVFATQAQTKMSSTEADALKTKVKALASATQTISSDFIQYKHLDFLDNAIETSGKLAFKSPNLLKWEYVKPFKYSVLFKDQTLFINDEGNKSNVDIGSNKMFKQLNELIINSVKGDMFDETEFRIEYFKKEANSLVYFFPKEKKFSKYIEAFHILFNEKGDVVEVKMIEPSQDYTKIVFTNKVLNQTIGNAVFTN